MPSPLSPASPVMTTHWARIMVGGMILAPLLTVSLPAQKARVTVESRAEPERPYRLFVGIDVKVPHGGDFADIQDFDTNRAKIGHEFVSIDDVATFRFDHATKLARVPISIADVSTEKTESNGESRTEWMRRQSALQSYGQDRINSNLATVASAASAATGGPVFVPGGNLEMPDSLNTAVNDYYQTAKQGEKISDSSYFAESAQTAREDALLIHATLSAPTPIIDAYVVGVARISTPDQGYSDVLFFQDIPRLGPEPQKVTLKRKGVAGDYEVMSVDLHIYREGQELVSNQSAKQFALTRDEAMEYLLLERVSSHRGQTLPASPAWSLAPAPLLAAIAPSKFDYPISVQVDPRGQVTSIDETFILPDHIKAIVADMLFLPAIANGVAVAGTAQFNLSDYFR
ncbi:hypothetical protein [Synoicihabitans lomoniglobus]|uniref:Uncharacterized protein n=1 Tax=Synoicihabitans lomoniglobus TaxID=2909285 RepID=A0AAE9ZVV3_9BACT|nr:hypothetical protein [Opitutaceae bacterium LMO-M01]WED64034.1 hypothetical protein PXH66_16980 [Opitutaceae bacterium LMO-M01]